MNRLLTLMILTSSLLPLAAQKDFSEFKSGMSDTKLEKEFIELYLADEEYSKGKTVHAIKIADRDWEMIKNDFGVPKYRLIWAYIATSEKGSCECQKFTFRQEYEGNRFSQLSSLFDADEKTPINCSTLPAAIGSASAKADYAKDDFNQFKAKMKNVQLEKEFKELFLADEEYGKGKEVLKTIIIDHDWEIIKNDFGTPLYRLIDAHIATKNEKGKCESQVFTFRQDYTGSGFTKVSTLFDDGEKFDINCSTITAGSSNGSAAKTNPTKENSNQGSLKAKIASEETSGRNPETGLTDEKYPNGKTKSSGTTKDGKKIGTWKYYTQTGEISMEENYNTNGDLNGKVLQFSKGSIQYETSYVNGKKDGRYVKYRPNGSLIEEGNYKNGAKDGIWKTYDDKGKLKEEKKYREGLPQQ